jgi:hypothetical protein
MQVDVDVIILNRNMRRITDALVETIKRCEQVKFCGVVDSGSREVEVSTYTFARDSSENVLRLGLRPNKGFHLGLSAWLELDSSSPWVLLLPNDSEIVEWNISELLSEINEEEKIVCVVPISPENPYRVMLPRSRIAFGWNFHEGPLLLRKSFVIDRFTNQGHVLDPKNFRGYMSFIELAFQCYTNNLGIVATDKIAFTENTSHIIQNHQLIGTEPIEINLQLLINEGEDWLVNKYGVRDRWSFELVTRLVFEEFLKVNPEIRFPALV